MRIGGTLDIFAKRIRGHCQAILRSGWKGKPRLLGLRSRIPGPGTERKCQGWEDSKKLASA